MTSKLKICNQALLLVGAEEINSFEDESREARICGAVYDDTKLNVLQKYPWAFTLEQTQLAETVATPLFGYSRSYQIPPKTLRIVKKDNVPNDYRIVGDKLYTDVNSVIILRQFDPGEGDYPSYVSRTIVLQMAKYLGAALMQDTEMSREYERQYNVQMREARSIDSQNEPAQLINPAEFAISAIRVQYT